MLGVEPSGGLRYESCRVLEIIEGYRDYWVIIAGIGRYVQMSRFDYIRFYSMRLRLGRMIVDVAFDVLFNKIRQLGF